MDFTAKGLHDGRDHVGGFRQVFPHYETQVVFPVNSDTGVFGLLLREILKPCLHQAAERLAKLADDGLVVQGYCPRFADANRS